MARGVQRHAAGAALFLAMGAALVDESGKYRGSWDMSSLAPAMPSQEDQDAAIDLSKQPIEKIFQLLAFELMREEKRPAETRLGLREFQDYTDLACPSRLTTLLQDVIELSEGVEAYHHNVTGTVGLYWLLHQYPQEKSWVWILSASHERLLWKVGRHLAKLETFAMDDRPLHSCFSANTRYVIMDAVSTWKRIYADYIALLWNGVAFGMLGDVTSWRELDENDTAEEGPGGPPPNVSWSENIIFGNMFTSSVQKWLDFYKTELSHALYAGLARLQQGMPPGDEMGTMWVATPRSGATGSSFEFLRKQIWGGWPLDKGLLRGLLRHVLKPGYGDNAQVSVADFGAGGGRYSTWLNETGLVHAFAFDGTFAAWDITRGAVMEQDLAAEVQLWRTFDWVLCLDPDVILSAASSSSGALLHNLQRHAVRGVVVALGPALSAEEVKATGLSFDQAATEAVRAACEFGHLRDRAAVFRLPA